jgi:hypothetical protein
LFSRFVTGSLIQLSVSPSEIRPGDDESHGDEDDMSLRQHLVDECGDAVLQDDEQSVMDTQDGDEVTSEIAPDDDIPLDFSTTRNAHAVSSSSSDDDDDEEDEEENHDDENPLHRLTKQNVSIYTYSGFARMFDTLVI